MNDHSHAIYGPCQQCHKYHAGPCPGEFELRPYKMPKPARGAICLCGHCHATGSDDEDLGCETCDCKKWKYPDRKTYPQGAHKEKALEHHKNSVFAWLTTQSGLRLTGWYVEEAVALRSFEEGQESIRGMLKTSEEDVANLKEIIEECATENKVLRGKLALAITYLRDHANLNVKEDSERFHEECMRLQMSDGPDCKGWPDLPDGDPK